MGDDDGIAGAARPGEVHEPSEPTPPAVTGEEVTPPIPSTRASRAWLRILPSLALLALCVVFVLQNPHGTKVTFLGFTGHPPLSAALLAAAAVGALVVLAVGSIRIAQLRSIVRRSDASRHDEGSIRGRRHRRQGPDSTGA